MEKEKISPFCAGALKHFSCFFIFTFHDFDIFILFLILRSSTSYDCSCASFVVIVCSLCDCLL